MPLSFDIEDIREFVRSAMGVALDLSPNKLIPEVGEEPVDLNFATLPLGIMQLSREILLIPGGQRGRAANDVVTVIGYRLWYVWQPRQGDDVLALTEAKVKAMGLAMMADRKFGGLVSNVTTVAMDWSGMGARAPINRVKGSAASGYFEIEIERIESYF